MKFLTDQDVYASTIGVLIGLGHDVLPVAQLGLAQSFLVIEPGRHRKRSPGQSGKS